MRQRSGQGLYRGGDSKKAKPTKAERISDFIQKTRQKASAAKIKNTPAA